MERLTQGSAIACQVGEEAALYALGALDAEASRRFAKRLDAGCPLCEHEVSAMSDAASAQAWALPAVAPRASLRDRLMARVDSQRSVSAYGESNHDGGASVVLESEGQWEPVCPGVTRKSLHYDPKANTATFLLRMDPDAVLPAHRHGGTEQCLVLQGEVEDGGTPLRQGDFQTLGRGSTHTAARSKSGCLLLIVAEEPAATRFL